LHLDLTVHLGQALRDEDDVPLFEPRRLNLLTRLPWFRHGFLPDWLRLVLISRLTKKQERGVRGELEALLLTSLQGDSGALMMKDLVWAGAGRAGRPPTRLVRAVLKTLSRQEPEDGPLRDHVFLSFMSGRRARPLAVRVPEALRGRLGTGRRRSLALAMAVVLSVVAFFIVRWQDKNHLPMHTGPVLLALGLGFLAGAIEAFTRYRDAPFKAVLKSVYGWLYLLFNAGFSVAAYGGALWWDKIDAVTPIDRLELALAAGLGGAVLARARIFSVKVGDNDVVIGPAFLLDQLLARLDREIDRERYRERYRERTRLVLEATKGIDFTPTARYARTLIFGSRQNLAAEQRVALFKKIRELESSAADGEQKLLALGFEILNVMGEVYFRDLVAEVRARGAATPDSKTPTSSTVEPGDAGRGDTSPAVVVRTGLSDVPLAEATRRFHALVAADSRLGLDDRQELLEELRQIAARGSNDSDQILAIGFLVFDFFGREVFEEHFPPR
jgi:hypothetical protein